MKERAQNNPITLYRPSLRELHYRRQLLADPASMAYNAPYDPKGVGTIDFPPETWEAFLDRWQKRSYFYAYIMMMDQPVGEIYYYPVEEFHQLGILIEASYQGKGYAKPALELLLEQAFIQDDVEALQNQFESARERALHLHLQLGFSVFKEENGMITLRYKREDYVKKLRQRRAERAYPLLLAWLEGENHMLLTGSLGSGKTWLVERLDKEEGPFHGLRSYKKGDCIWMEERLEKKAWKIGERRNSLMQVCPEGFQKATEYLRRFQEQKHTLLIIDEVGFVEEGMKEYLQEIIHLAGRQPLLLVLRKDRNALQNHIHQLGPVQTMDLDKI